MGYFDGLGTSLKEVAGGAVTGATATVFDYFKATAGDALVKVGIAPSGNLTPEEIAAGKTGAPPQPTVVPSKTPASDLAGAVPGGSVMFMNKQIPVMALAAAAVAAYFILKRR